MQHITIRKRMIEPIPLQKRQRGTILFVLLCLLLLGLALSGCDSGNNQQKTITNDQNQAISYNAGANDLILRTFYGGGKLGAFQLAPTISLYGDGSYILGSSRQGKLSSDDLQQLLKTLIGTDGLLSFHTTQFYDLPDQNATYLELYLNGKQHELIYGSFGNQVQSSSDMDEYHRLDHALTTITNTLNGPLHPYNTTTTALLIRQEYFVDQTQLVDWPLNDYSAYQAAVYECGKLIDVTDPTNVDTTNVENGCLKYRIPQHAILLTDAQHQALTATLGNSSQGIFVSDGKYFEVTIRPLLPDEIAQKNVAMFGSNQSSYTRIPLESGTVPAATS